MGLGPGVYYDIEGRSNSIWWNLVCLLFGIFYTALAAFLLLSRGKRIQEGTARERSFEGRIMVFIIWGPTPSTSYVYIHFPRSVTEVRSSHDLPWKANFGKE